MKNWRDQLSKLVRRQDGSAYIVALLALVVLTIIGLSLALVTQTEFEIGANERVINRVFYAADSGINIAAAMALTGGQYSAPQFLIDEQGSSFSKSAERVDVSPFFAVNTGHCNWCPTNEDRPTFFSVDHSVTATAQRVGWTGTATSPPTDATPLATKQIAVFFLFTPWEGPPTTALSDPEDKVRF